MPQQPIRLQLGDILRLRKEHPCGAFDFEVVRLGADIGLRCVGCNRRILLARSLLERRLERFVSREPDAPLDLSEFGGTPAREQAVSEAAASEAAASEAAASATAASATAASVQPAVTDADALTSVSEAPQPVASETLRPEA